MNRKIIKWAALTVFIAISLFAGIKNLPSGYGYSNGILYVDFINVGQGDSSFIRFPDGKCMLIDAGNSSNAKTIINYIKKCGYRKLDYVIATHPHSDHIGGLPEVLSQFKIGKLYISGKNSDDEFTKKILDICKQNKIDISDIYCGLQINIKNNLHARFLAPVKKYYEDINSLSAVLYLTYSEHSFLFMADAGEDSEKEIMSMNQYISADVIKMGHHGAEDSASDEFLNAVNPDYAVISVGLYNGFSHPSKSLLTRLESRGIKVLRTDILGNISFKSDGNNPIRQVKTKW